MATAVASRFAVLSIDDDDDVPKKSQPKKKPDPKKPASGQNQSNSNKKKNTKKNEPGKVNQNNQNSANKNKSKQGGKPEGSQKKKGGGGNVSQDQWDQWKKKDSEMVDCNYEQDLHQAILLSKLDYEEKKDVYEQTRKTSEDERKQSAGTKKAKKANKPQPMSLEEFNNLQDQGESEVEVTSTNELPQPQQVPPDTEFFDRIRSDTKKVLTKEQEADRRKAREPFIQQAITVAQLEDQLEKKSRENEVLKEEIVKLKEELHNVRTRNKKLCNILAQGEMKDKAEVLVEVDQLQRMRDELSSEVSSLHAQLEQERSKVRSLTADTKGRPQNKKQRSTSETNHQ